MVHGVLSILRLFDWWYVSTILGEAGWSWSAILIKRGRGRVRWLMVYAICVCLVLHFYCQLLGIFHDLWAPLLLCFTSITSPPAAMFDRDGNGTINFTEFGNLWKYINDWQNTFRSVCDCIFCGIRENYSMLTFPPVRAWHSQLFGAPLLIGSQKRRWSHILFPTSGAFNRIVLLASAIS